MMHKLTFILTLLVFGSLLGQDVYFKTYTTDNGLSNNSVNDIENDVKGGLWIGTWDGLNYFDGNEFLVYKHIKENPQSISGNEIISVLKDKYDTVWALTHKGLSKYVANNQFENFFLNEKITAVYLSKHSELIVVLGDKKFVYNNQQFLRDDEEPLPSEKQEYFIYKKILLSKNPHLLINDIYIDSDKVLFATKFNGLFQLKIINNTYQITNYKSDRYNPLSFKSNEIEEIHKDVFGGIWLAFKDGGISLLQESIKGVTTIVPHPKHFPHLPSETVRAITKDSDDDLYIGYYSKGLQKFDKQENCFLPVPIDKAKTNSDWNRVRSLYTDSKGAVWVGTYAGLIRIFKDRIQYFDAASHAFFPNNRNYSFFEDDEQNLWIGCWGGVAKININTLQFQSFYKQDRLKNIHVRDIVVNNETLLIASENEGLVIFDSNSGMYQKMTEKDGLAGDSVFSILYLKEQKTFWIACLGGISVINEAGIILKTITEKDGLPSHMVYGLLTENGKIWASTTKGIVRIDANTYRVEKINNSVKWQATEFSEGAYYKDQEGRLFFGGIKGVSFFHPKDLTVSTYLPKLNVHIESKANKNGIYHKAHNENYIKAKIIPIAFEKNTNNTVQYKLEGYDDHWQNLNDDFQIFYKQLPYKTYHLLIKNSLAEDDEVLTYTFVINKPFYLSSWFLWGLLSILVVILILYLYIKNKKTKAYHQKLEFEIEKRTQTITHQKEELVKLHNSIRNHEFEMTNFKRFVVDKFKQPLSLIIENVSKIPDSFSEKQVIHNQVNYLMNSVLEWDYLDKITKLSEYKKSITQAVFIKQQFEQYIKDFKSDDVSYEITFKSEAEYIELDIIRCKLMIQYILNVLLNYNTPNSSYTFDITVSNKTITIVCVLNNHILTENLEEIMKYNRYYNAYKVLLSDLKGESTRNVQKNTLFYSVSLPFEVPSLEETQNKLKTTRVTLDELPEDKAVLLVYVAQENVDTAKSLLELDQYYLLFESNLRDVSKYVSKTERFQAVIFYNIAFSSKTIELIRFISKNKSLPTIYISEKIDFLLLEKIQQYHIDELIQLPVSKKFIYNKMKQQLARYHNQQIEIIPEVDKASPNQLHVEQAIEIIETYFSHSDFNVEFLIDKLNISRVKCYRMFKEVLHQSPSDYINQFRMKQAVRLLKKGTLNISQVAFECGYNDPKYFSKSFKKFYGMTPKKYIDTFFNKS